MSTAAATRAATAPNNFRLRFGEPVLLAVYLGVCLLAAALWMEFITRPGPGFQRSLATPLWTMAIGIATNTSCAVLGCYLVLRRMSLLGDAISHAVLPGLAVAFILSGQLYGTPMFVGAVICGVLTSVLTQAISGLGRVSEDTSMGVVFTSMFALGVVLVTAFASRAHIDAECILYGQIEYAAVDTPPADQLQVPRSMWALSATLLVTLGFVAVLWKELKIVAFDPALAAAMGFSVPFIHYALMAMVATVTVSSFEAVGSILVVAMLIVPAASAALVTDRLRWMLAWAVAFGIVCALFGYLAAAALETNVAGMMAVVAGVQFAGAVLLSPRHGLVSRWLRNLSLAVRIASEDVVARLYRAEEAGIRGQESGVRSQETVLMASGGRKPPEATRRGLVDWLASFQLSRRQWVDRDRTGALQLTPGGRAAARNLVRAHRLWESYLDTHFDLPRDHLHEPAERMEHFLDPRLQEELAAELAGRAVDPHGKTIPPATAEGEPH